MPRQIKSEQMMSGGYIDTADLSSRSEAPIDLSRRSDSVETRKTPSPYNSSGFGESSPSFLNESPTSLTRSAVFGAALAHPRSDTPPNRYQSAASHRFAYENERSPSPPSKIPMHHRFMREQSINSTEDEINPYLLHAVAFQEKLSQNMPSAISSSGQSSPDSLQFPMVLGHDGKMARPFKAYPRDPLSMSAAIPASDSLVDRLSAERFNIFRQQMLEQIHAANGGRPTITNPKMRRINQKIDEMDFQQQQQIEAQNQANSQSDSSSSANKDPVKDSAYFERRRKNNAAAKKSRDRRRIKEDEIAIRAAFLERENFELKIELATAKRQLAKFLEK